MSTPILLDPLPLIIIWEPVEVSPQYSITLTAHIIQLWLGLSISREAQNQVQSEYDTSRSIWFSTRYINLQLVRLFIEHPNCFQWWGIPTVFAKPIAFVPESPVCAHGARVSRIWLIWTLLAPRIDYLYCTINSFKRVISFFFQRQGALGAVVFFMVFASRNI